MHRNFNSVVFSLHHSVSSHSHQRLNPSENGNVPGVAWKSTEPAHGCWYLPSCYILYCLINLTDKKGQFIICRLIYSHGKCLKFTNLWLHQPVVRVSKVFNYDMATVKGSIVKMKQ